MLHQNLRVEGGKLQGRGRKPLPTDPAWPGSDGLGQARVGDPAGPPRRASWLAWGGVSVGDGQARWGAPGTLHLSLSPCPAECQRLCDAMALPTFSESLTLCVSAPCGTHNSPSHKGSQRREGAGLPGVPVPSCLRSSMSPWRPLEGLTPRGRICSCSSGRLLPKGRRRHGFGACLCLLLAGGPGQVVHLETLSFSLCKMGRWLQPL